MKNEDKLFKIFSDRFVRMWKDCDDKKTIEFSMVCSVWRNYIGLMGMKLTAIDRDKTSIFVLDPMTRYARMGEKPTMYIQMDKDAALKILALEYLP